ncbi:MULTISPECIES: LysR family transcriptional regulator [Aeromonas]|uniref:LysR family transcriptional regulator n=1 Tax=Aeromonas TaxID=642 RepID=UPI000FB324A5|nr:LysR family transcriptional regulator [Aeromonas media]MBL0514027.1 LysR family transcriptional regulator [Aeromonas media]
MDNHKLDTLYLMRLLLAIARFGSFAAAASHLGITPSKASKDLRHLEQSLGAVLLGRTTRRVQLTDAGKLACQQADQMVALHEELLDGLQRRRHSLCGELRITAPDLWGEVVLTPVLLRFRTSHPEVRIIADFSNHVADLVRDNLHVAFRSTVLRSEPYLARPIVQDDLVLCASEAYLATHPPLVQPQDLQHHSLITRSQDYGRREHWTLLHQGKEILLEVAGELAFSNKKSIQMAMAQGLGIARLPRYLVADELASGSVCEVLPAYRPKGAHFYALYTQRRADSALITHFLDYVIRELGGPATSTDPLSTPS